MTDAEQKQQIQKVVRRIEQELKGFGLKKYYVAQTGSTYLRFRDSRLRSVRVGDHDGREKYRYKWNLRSDIPSSFERNDRTICRFYFTFNNISAFVKRVKEYHQDICKQEK